MANVPNPPNSATAAPAGVPESPQAPTTALPFALSETMTAAQAEQRLVELRTDEAWRARWIVGDAPANTEFDALTRKAVGQQPPAPIAPRDENDEALRALGPPATVKDYKIDIKDPATGWPVQIHAVERAVIDGVLLPAAHSLGLSQGDVAMIGDIIVRPMDAEKCEQTLRNIWRGHFEQGVKDFVDAMAAQPRIRDLLLDDRYEMTLQNNPALISSIVAAYRRKQGRR